MSILTRRLRGPLVWALGLLCAVTVGLAQQQQPPRTIVYVAPITGIIDLGLAPYVQRVLDEAGKANAAAVVLDINTFGGRVDAAVQIRDALLQSKMRTIAFVNKRAISAGALISLAAQTIVMGSGATIGAATPVQMGGQGSAALPVEEKTVSYVRKEFRATAESRGRPLLVAEAMVDADVEIPDLIAKGKLLTLTTEEAILHKLADLRADTLEEALQQAGLGGAEVRRLAPNWAENVVRFLTHPIVSSLLITVAMLGILIELRTPGFGVPGGLGVTSLALFMWGHWLVQLAGWEELLLTLAGVLLLLIELFVIPGFGIVGALGILAVLAGLLMSMIGPGNTPQLVLLVSVRLVAAMLLALAAGLVLLRFMVRLPLGRKLVLDSAMPAGQGWSSEPEKDHAWLGKRGRATSVLRPAGIAEIEGSRVDVVAEGEMIDAGEAIEVLRVDGNRVVVKRAPAAEHGSM